MQRFDNRMRAYTVNTCDVCGGIECTDNSDTQLSEMNCYHCEETIIECKACCLKRSLPDFCKDCGGQDLEKKTSFTVDKAIKSARLSRENMNTAIAATTGAGKSFLLQSYLDKFCSTSLTPNQKGSTK